MVFASDLNTKLTQKVLFESFNLVADADFSEIETEIFGKKQELMLKVEHIAIAVKNLTDSVPLFEKLLNSKCYKTEEVEIEKVKTAFLKTGETKIELLEST